MEDFEDKRLYIRITNKNLQLNKKHVALVLPKAEKSGQSKPWTVSAIYYIKWADLPSGLHELEKCAIIKTHMGAFIYSKD